MTFSNMFKVSIVIVAVDGILIRGSMVTKNQAGGRYVNHSTGG